MPADTALTLEGVSFTYPGWPPVVEQIDWTLGVGEFHCLVGRSGCGKTSLLKLAAGLLEPIAGQILLDGRRASPPGPRTGFVFQAPTLLDWLDVLDNVLLPVSLRRKPGVEDRSLALELLGQVGLLEHARKYPRQLSGGQQSRVALARALVLSPPVLLMDEPFAALDAITREELQLALQTICVARQTAVLFVTHDIEEAVFLADRVAVMEHGRIVFDLPVDLPRPRALSLRYQAGFNTMCASLREALGGVAP